MIEGTARRTWFMDQTRTSKAVRWHPCGEPIVITPQNAYSTFARSEMDLLVAGDCLVAK